MNNNKIMTWPNKNKIMALKFVDRKMMGLGPLAHKLHTPWWPRCWLYNETTCFIQIASYPKLVFHSNYVYPELLSQRREREEQAYPTPPDLSSLQSSEPLEIPHPDISSLQSNESPLREKNFTPSQSFLTSIPNPRSTPISNPRQKQLYETEAPKQPCKHPHF